MRLEFVFFLELGNLAVQAFFGEAQSVDEFFQFRDAAQPWPLTPGQ